MVCADDQLSRPASPAASRAWPAHAAGEGGRASPGWRHLQRRAGDLYASPLTQKSRRWGPRSQNYSRYNKVTNLAIFLQRMPFARIAASYIGAAAALQLRLIPPCV